jgi:hypothetical protein
MAKTVPYKSKFPIADYFTQNFLLSSEVVNDYWENQINISNSMVDLYKKVIEDSYKEYLPDSDPNKLNAYFEHVIKVLGKGFYLPISESKLSRHDREKLMADFVLIAQDCFRETVKNHLMFSSDAVLLPIYEKYQEQVNTLKKRATKS